MGVEEVFNNKYLNSLCCGLDLYKAKNRLLRIFSDNKIDMNEENIDICYEDSLYPRFTVLKCEYKRNTNCVLLTVASSNPIRHLPSNFQSNSFLANFLMIFQHIFNEHALVLDNMHELFRPMECPSFFLPVIADWFGVHLDTLGNEDEVRKFLQYAIPLYRFRGTVIGLRTHLYIVSGIVPEILEGEAPYSSMEISENSDVDVNLFDSNMIEDIFTVYFPVPDNYFDENSKKRLSLIIQQEKPVHTRCYLSFKKKEAFKRKITTIGKDSMMDFENGILI